MSKIYDLTEFCNTIGDEEIIREIIIYFINTYKENMDNIKMSILNNKKDELKQYAHSLKGEILNFRVEKAYELAYELEQFGKNSITDNTYEVYKELLNELTELESYFRLFLKGEE